MFERYTDRARKVVQLANQEAHRFNHEYVGTEHLLLGLAKEDSGVAAIVLRNLGVTLRKIRLEVAKIVQSGPEIVSMGKLPLTPRSRQVLKFAEEEARAFEHNYVGTEHLLLGLLREQEGVAAQVLMNLGLKIDEVRETVHNLLGGAQATSPPASEAKRDDRPASFPFDLSLDEQAFILTKRAAERLVRELDAIGSRVRVDFNITPLDPWQALGFRTSNGGEPS